VPYVMWESDPVTISADDALAPTTESQQTKRGDAAEFLEQLLSTTPLKVDDIKKEAKDAGYSWATVRRAKDIVGAKSKKSGFTDGGWCWYLPLSKVLSRADKIVSNLGESEHLREIEGAQNDEDAQGAQLAHGGKSGHLGECTAAEYAAARDGEV
jgi:hypothetical protein